VTGGVASGEPASAAARITVLLPLKNYHPEFLEAALGSIFGQTSGTWRLSIVVEPETAASFRALLSDPLRDPRVRLVENQGRKLAGALNTGMRTAETDFVAILLGDDLLALNAIETLDREILSHPEADLFHTARQVVDESGRPISSVHDAPDTVELGQFVWKSPVHHLLCWRRQSALAFGGMDETLNNVGPDDYDFPWTLLERGAVFRAVHQCLYFYRDHQAAYRLTTHLPRTVHLRELRRILEKHRVDESLIRERLDQAKRSFLKQCTYRNELHRRLLELFGLRPRPGSRLRYE
jgi:hypothetical protein